MKQAAQVQAIDGILSMILKDKLIPNLMKKPSNEEKKKKAKKIEEKIAEVLESKPLKKEKPKGVVMSITELGMFKNQPTAKSTPKRSMKRSK